MDYVESVKKNLRSKYNGRFDISFDKNIQEAINFGKKYLSVTIYL
jgi:hypothetical protein